MYTTVFIGALLLDCLSQEDRAAKAHAEAKVWLSEMEKAEVTFYKLDPKRLEKAEEGTFQRYRILETKKLEDAKVIEKFRDVLAEPKTFHEDAWGCFSPGMGLRFKTRTRESDLVICLKCNRIVVTKDGKESYWDLSFMGSALLKGVYDDIVTKQVRFMDEVAAWSRGLEKAEVTFYKIDPNSRRNEVKGEEFRGYPVLNRKPFKEDQELLAILKDPKTFETLAASCFDPGMGFHFKAGEVEGDLVICLDCLQIKAYKRDLEETWVLSKEGGERLLKIYESMAPKAEK